MPRYQIVLRRRLGSLLDLLPLRVVALAYVQSLEGLRDVRLEYASGKQTVLSFAWPGEGMPVIPVDHLDRYGLERTEFDQTVT
ncbi:hypothetical protein [Lysobacter enzymogenes]|uniref:hypothetical protein n=1 Tax=Lysobacter enzymogenes TaxID=69 RepID=UPI00099E0EF5|nr:hypothetical protein [Lysobacter enzymogenes]UZW61831.1 hypothetical protein BV903_005895 [Lysobacter enzymogenes]